MRTSSLERTRATIREQAPSLGSGAPVTGAPVTGAPVTGAPVTGSAGSLRYQTSTRTKG